MINKLKIIINFKILIILSLLKENAEKKLILAKNEKFKDCNISLILL